MTFVIQVMLQYYELMWQNDKLELLKRIFRYTFPRSLLGNLKFYGIVTGMERGRILLKVNII